MRERTVFCLLTLVAVAVLSGCATEPKVAGTEVGGAMPVAGATQKQLLEAAQAHCGKYGRSARMLSVHRDADGKAVFECI